MNIGFTRNQELAAEQLRAVAPLVQLARQAFIAIGMHSTVAASGTLENAARNKSLTLAKAILILEHDLKRVIGGKSN
jgi:hypothetical protein